MEGAGHVPVLPGAVVELLAPATARVVVDCTIGLGGHAEALLAAAGKETTLLGIDLDRSNLLKTKDRLARFGARVRLFEANFADLPEVLAEAGTESADAILADLGVSSSQLDDPSRGFGFQADGPLDMRFGREGRSAADLVNTLGEAELADLIRQWGEDRYGRRIARAIVRARRRERIERTGQLARVVAGAVPPGSRRRRIHPATRSFQALRIAVNREMDNLSALLARLPESLAPGGRAGVIAFHSLEDRAVKRSFAAAVRAGTALSLTPKPRTPGLEEIRSNPRSRSAKFRVIERIG